MSQRFESKCLEIPVLLLRHQTNSITTDRDEGGLNGHDMESKRSCVLMTLWRYKRKISEIPQVVVARTQR